MRKSFAAFVAACAVCATAATPSMAASVFGPGTNTIIYHNYENIFSANGLQKASVKNVPAQAAVGDILFGILSVDSIYSDVTSSYSFQSSSTSELTGLFGEKVVGFTSTLGVTQAIFAPITQSDYNAVIAGSGGFKSAYDSSIVTLPAAWNFALGQEFAFYQQTGSANFTATGLTLAQSEATATDGSLLFTLGYTVGDATTLAGATGYFYGNINNTSGTKTSIDSHGGLQFLINGTGSTFVLGAAVDGNANANAQAIPVQIWTQSAITDNLSVNGQTVVAPWDFISRDPAKAVSLIPIPASLWTGLGMLGVMGGVAAIRRRKSAQS